MVPLAGAAVVLTAVSRFRASDLHAASAARRMETMACEWRPFALFVAMFSVSSGIATGLMTFVPLYLVDDRGATPATANVMTSVLLAAAAAGTVLGGYVSHRLGRRFVFVVPQLVLVPAIALLPVVARLGRSCRSSPWPALCSSANMAVAVVSAQEYLPSRMGLATGLTMGVCGGVGGLIVAALGPLGDAAGPAAVLYVLAALPLAVAVLAALLPRPAACPDGHPLEPAGGRAPLTRGADPMRAVPLRARDADARGARLRARDAAARRSQGARYGLHPGASTCR